MVVGQTPGPSGLMRTVKPVGTASPIFTFLPVDFIQSRNNVIRSDSDPYQLPTTAVGATGAAQGHLGGGEGGSRAAFSLSHPAILQVR